MQVQLLDRAALLARLIQVQRPNGFESRAVLARLAFGLPLPPRVENLRVLASCEIDRSDDEPPHKQPEGARVKSNSSPSAP
jgi:hypothetical protein